MKTHFPLTSDQIRTIAPDDASFTAGKGLAEARNWKTLGVDELALWGEFQGSGKEPYKVCIDRINPGYACTCPSRKFPCKHALGLMLLAVGLPDRLGKTVAPSWVTAWLEKRAARSQPASSKTKADEDKAARQKEADRRAARREKLAATGIQTLERWLKDLIGAGLAAAPGLPQSYWEEQAARLVDAQLPSAARLVHELSAMPLAGDDWAEAFLLKLARLYLLVQAYKHIENLPPETQADVRALLGWTIDQSELVASTPGLRDDWLVMSQSLEEDAGGLRTQTNWLWGKESQRAGLILTFAHRSQAMDMSLFPGLCVRGEMIYFPGAHPLRGIFKEQQPVDRPFIPTGYANIKDFLLEYCSALAKNPWIEKFPALLEKVIPIQVGGTWMIYDHTKQALPLSRRFGASWQLLALSGGVPFTLFGLWDGSAFSPGAAWAEERYVGFS